MPTLLAFHIHGKHADFPLSMLPIYKELIAAGLRVWIFSGDTDAIVPLTVTRYSIGALNLSAIANWYPRYDNGKVIRSVKQKELGTQIDHLNKKMAQAFVYA